MKRLFQPLLAILLACGLSVGGFAAEESSPVALLREALHAESLGHSQLRGQVAATTPDSPLAQAYSGNVQQGKAWLSIDDAIAKLNQDRRLQQYQALREKSRDTAADHVQLANWCRKKGLPQFERVHLLRSVDFDPDNELLRKRLGHVRGERQWLSREEVSRQAALATAKEEWLPKFRSMQQLLQLGTTPQRQQVREQLLEIRDPLAAEALEEAFSHNEGDARCYWKF